MTHSTGSMSIKVSCYSKLPCATSQALINFYEVFLYLFIYLLKAYNKYHSYGWMEVEIKSRIYLSISTSMSLSPGEQKSTRKKNQCPEWGSNSRPSDFFSDCDYETDALPTALSRHMLTHGNITLL